MEELQWKKNLAQQFSHTGILVRNRKDKPEKQENICFILCLGFRALLELHMIWNWLHKQPNAFWTNKIKKVNYLVAAQLILDKHKRKLEL